MNDQPEGNNELAGQSGIAYRIRGGLANLRKRGEKNRINDRARPRSKEKRAVSIRSFANLEPEDLRWLWPSRVPYGKLSLLVGDPQMGKSWVSLDLAARTSIGGWLPDGVDVQSGDVLLLSAEDGAADTIQPRLEAQGADLKRVHHISLTVGRGREDSILDLERDLGARPRNTVGECLGV